MSLGIKISLHTGLVEYGKPETEWTLADAERAYGILKNVTFGMVYSFSPVVGAAERLMKERARLGRLVQTLRAMKN